MAGEQIETRAGGGYSISDEKKALIGMIGPVVFGPIVVLLTVVQYDFMVGLGWHPIETSDVPWPSGLALGPYGFLQVANFVFFGLTVIVLAAGLHHGVKSGRGSWVGPALLALAGVALVLSGFKTEPSKSAQPETWHGLIHLLAFFLFSGSLLLSFPFLGWRLSKDPLWKKYGWYTLVVMALVVLTIFIPFQVGFYLFVALLLVWIEVVALRLRSVSRSASEHSGTDRAGVATERRRGEAG